MKQTWLSAASITFLAANRRPLGLDTLEDEVLRTLSADQPKTLRRLLERVLEGLFSEAKV